MESLASFVLAGIALTGSPGPATLGLAASGAAFGIRRSFALLTGILAGVLLVIALTASGLAGLILAQPSLGQIVSILGVGYMLYLAYRIGTAPPPAMHQETDPPGFLPGMFLGLGNPKAYAAMAALFSGFVLLRERPLADALAKTLVLLAIMIGVNLIWLALGSALSRALHHPRLGRAINIAFAILLVASVAMTITL